MRAEIVAYEYPANNIHHIDKAGKPQGFIVYLFDSEGMEFPKTSGIKPVKCDVYYVPNSPYAVKFTHRFEARIGLVYNENQKNEAAIKKALKMVKLLRTIQDKEFLMPYSNSVKFDSMDELETWIKGA